jgi:hypothetical protein
MFTHSATLQNSPPSLFCCNGACFVAFSSLQPRNDPIPGCHGPLQRVIAPPPACNGSLQPCYGALQLGLGRYMAYMVHCNRLWSIATGSGSLHRHNGALQHNNGALQYVFGVNTSGLKDSSPAMNHNSPATYHNSPETYHKSPLTYHNSPATRQYQPGNST